MEAVATALVFMAGACLVFLLLCWADDRGYLRRVKKFGNPQIGGRASLRDRWQPPSQPWRGDNGKEPGDDSRRNDDS